MEEWVVVFVPLSFDWGKESEDSESQSIFCVLERMCELSLEQSLGKMSLAEVAEVVWPSGQFLCQEHILASISCAS